MTRGRLTATATALGLVVAAACAQPPTKELALVGERVEAAKRVGAELFAPELLAQAEAGLAQAERLVETEHAHREALRAASEASLAAEDALRSAESTRAAVERKLDYLRAELDALLEIAVSRGAEESDELRALRERCAHVGTVAASGDVLGALGEATALKPELLAFERRYR